MSVTQLRSPEAVDALRARQHGAVQRTSELPWPPGATLSEIFAGNGRDAGAVGFALAQSPGDGPLLWVQDRMSIGQTGRPYPPGLDADLIHVEARDALAALWAMEEGLKCSALRAVVGEIWGNPKALDFTATRRLAVAAERGGVAAILLLSDAQPDLSGARMRWRVVSRPSPPHPFDPLAPGAPAWSLNLFKARGACPGRWQVSHEADGLHLLPPAGDGELGEAQALGLA